MADQTNLPADPPIPEATGSSDQGEGCGCSPFVLLLLLLGVGANWNSIKSWPQRALMVVERPILKVACDLEVPKFVEEYKQRYPQLSTQEATREFEKLNGILGPGLSYDIGRGWPVLAYRVTFDPVNDVHDFLLCVKSKDRLWAEVFAPV